MQPDRPTLRLFDPEREDFADDEPTAATVCCAPSVPRWARTLVALADVLIITLLAVLIGMIVHTGDGDDEPSLRPLTPAGSPAPDFRPLTSGPFFTP